MINEELIKENQLLKEELEKTKYILHETQEHLKKYTALGQYRGEERPVCFSPEKVAVKPRKSDKRAKACDSPLLT